VKAWVLSAVIVAGSASGVIAQSPGHQPDTDTIRARQKISIVEGSFERAVQNGADNFLRQIRAVAPEADGMAMLMGVPVVRGFRLSPPGPSGVFFDVQIPSLQLSMVWPLRFTTQQSDDRRRPTSGAAVASLQGTTTSATPQALTDANVLDEPGEAWRREVRATLIDAILENTGGITVGPDEFIIVAARGMMPPDRLADPGEARTIELKLKGSDLQAFRANTISLEEARTRVEPREY
jgi:hypothetical protein